MPIEVSFKVPGRPVPWKTHVGFGNRSTKDARLYEWQEAVKMVAMHAAAQYGIRSPWSGAVGLAVDFAVLCRPGRPPDLTNLLKAVEDACQGVVFLNDTQVFRTAVSRRFVEDGKDEGVDVRVELL